MDFALLLFVSFLSFGHGFLMDENCVHCNWNGVCDTRHKRCVCYDGFEGVDCSVDCGCQGHGRCKSDMTCQCDKGWKWSVTDKKCIWDCPCSNGIDCIGPGICGCIKPCQYGTCFNGQCECWEGYKGETCNILDRDIMMNKDVRLGLNIAGISYWSPEEKFVDIAKQSQEWITERLEGPMAHQWDTKEHDSVTWRDDGYPASLPKSMVIGKLVLRSQAGIHGPQGNFTVLYDGDGELGFSLVKKKVHYNGKGRMVVEFHENQGGIFIKIMRTNPANPIHNIRFIMPGFDDRHALFPFYPAFLEDIRRYSEIRFMDFLHTNAHAPEPTTWATRRQQLDHSQTGNKGAAIEYAIELANLIGADAWFPQPHAADDDFVRQFAQMAKTKLRPDIKIYIEYSNEVWNGIFRQSKYAKDEGAKLGDTTYKATFKYYNKRATEVVDIWRNVFGSDKDRIIGVWAWQTGYQDYTRQALGDLGTRISHFDAIGITGYFDCDHVANKKNISTLTHAQIAQLCKNEVGKVKSSFQHYLDVAKAHNVKLLMYEGGPGMVTYNAIDHNATEHAIKFDRSDEMEIVVTDTHNVKLLMYEGGPGMVTYNAIDHNATEHAIKFDRSDEMEIAVTDVLESWFNITNTDPNNNHPGGLFNYFSSVTTPSKYGNWGMLEYTGQDLSRAPKYRAVHKYINKHFQNNYYGPKCSFTEHSGNVYGCFTFKTGNLGCGYFQKTRYTWAYYPTVTTNQSAAIIMEGFDTQDNVILVRAVDNLAADSYFMLDTTVQNPQWISMTYANYHAKLAPSSVIHRQPQGVHNNVDITGFSC